MILGDTGAFIYMAFCVFDLLEIGGAGGRGEIRTHEGLSSSPVFKTGAFNRSATLPLRFQPYIIRNF